MLSGPRLVSLIQTFLESGIDEKIASINSDAHLSIVNSVKIARFEIGKRMPFVKKITCCSEVTGTPADSSSSPEDVLIMVDYGYDGGARFVLTADMGLGLKDVNAKLDLKKILTGRLFIKVGWGGTLPYAKALYDCCCYVDKGRVPRLTFTLASLPPFTISLLYGHRRLMRISALLDLIVCSVIQSRLAVLPGQRIVLLDATASSMVGVFRPVPNAELKRRLQVLIRKSCYEKALLTTQQSSKSVDDLSTSLTDSTPIAALKNTPANQSNASLSSSSDALMSNISLQLSLDSQVEKSPVYEFSDTWNWLVTFPFPLQDQTQASTLTVQMFQRKGRLNRQGDMIGQATIDLKQLRENEAREVKVDLLNTVVTASDQSQNGDWLFLDCQVTLKQFKEIDVSEASIDKKLLVGIPEAIKEQMKQGMQNSTSIERSLHWSNLKNIVEKMKERVPAGNAGAPSAPVAASSDQADGESSARSDQGMDLESPGVIHRHSIIPTAQQEHIDQIVADWDAHFEGKQEASQNDNLKRARSILGLMQIESSGVATPFQHRFTLTEQSIKAAPPVVRVLLPHALESIEQIIAPEGDEFVKEIKGRLDLMNSHQQEPKVQKKPSVNVRLGIYKVSTSKEGKLLLQLDRRDQSWTSLDHRIEYKSEVDLVCIHHGEGSIYPDFVLGKACAVSLTDSVVYIEDLQLELEFVDQYQAVELYCLLLSRSLYPDEKVTAIDLRNAKSINLVYQNELIPIAIFVRVNGMQELLLTAAGNGAASPGGAFPHDDDSSGQLLEAYCRLRLNHQTAASPTMPSSMRFTGQSTKVKRAPSQSGKQYLSTPDWLSQSARYLFACTHGHRRSLQKGVLGVTPTHVLFSSFITSGEEENQEKRPLSAVIAWKEIYGWRYTRKYLVTKGVLFELGAASQGAALGRKNSVISMESARSIGERQQQQQAPGPTGKEIYFFGFKELDHCLGVLEAMVGAKKLAK